MCARFRLQGYKRASLSRRIDNRLADLRIDDYAQYLDYFEVHPEEFEVLFDTVLINRRAGQPIRAWSAG